MKKSIPVLLFILCIGVGLASTRFLQAADPAPKTPTTKPAEKPAEPAKAENTKCPVSGEDVDPKVTAVVDGKTYAFCCADCVSKFKENPKKYTDK